jgi:hypothetical protein
MAAAGNRHDARGRRHKFGDYPPGVTARSNRGRMRGAIKSGGSRRSEAPAPAFPSPPRLRGRGCPGRAGRGGREALSDSEDRGQKTEDRKFAASKRERRPLPALPGHPPPPSGEGKAIAGASSGVFPPLLIAPPDEVPSKVQEKPSPLAVPSPSKGGEGTPAGKEAAKRCRIQETEDRKFAASPQATIPSPGPAGPPSPAGRCIQTGAIGNRSARTWVTLFPLMTGRGKRCLGRSAAFAVPSLHGSVGQVGSPLPRRGAPQESSDS